MIKPYYQKILEHDSLIKCAKIYYNIIKSEKLDANGLFIIKDMDNNKLYKFEITNKKNNFINENDSIIKRIEVLENKISNIEKIIISNN